MFSDSRTPRLAAHQFLSAHEENVRALVINMSFLRPEAPREFPSISCFDSSSSTRYIASCCVACVFVVSFHFGNENVVA